MTEMEKSPGPLPSPHRVRRQRATGRGCFSHLERTCKVLEQLPLSGCRCESIWFRLSVTDRLRLQSQMQQGASSPWHSGATSPPCRPDGASRSFDVDGWGVPGFGQWMPAESVLAAEEAGRLRGAPGVAALLESGTPGSDHVGKLGKARRRPNTRAGTVCRCPASGDDLTLARRIGRIWTRPVVRGNIALFGRQEQTYRAFAGVDLCGCRRHGRSRAHTFRGESPPCGTIPRVTRDHARGLRRTSMGAR